MKKIRIYLIIILLTGLVFTGKSQGFDVNGVVYSDLQKTPVENAYCIGYQGNLLCITDSLGRFSFTTQHDQIILKIKHIGFLEQAINLTHDTTIQIILNSKEIDGVEIISEDLSHKEIISGKISLTGKQIKNIPQVLGEVDVVKSLAQLPGVGQSSIGQSVMYIRGGERYGNQFLIDGIPFYNITHGFGFISMIDGNNIENINFYKGAFPSKYGGFSASITDIKTIDGNRNKIKGTFSPGLMKSKLTIEGPINEKLTFVLSLRTTHINYFLKRYYMTKQNIATSSSFKYNFFDINSKICFYPTDKHKIQILNFSSSNIYTLNYHHYEEYPIVFSTEETQFRTNNQTSAIKHQWFLRENKTLTTSLYFNSFKNSDIRHKENNMDHPLLVTDSEFHTNISSINLTSDYTSQSNQQHKHSFGFRISKSHQDPLVLNQLDVHQEKDSTEYVMKEDRINCIEGNVFIDEEYKPTSTFAIRAGARFNLFYNEKTFLNLEPRISVKYELNDSISIKAGYAFINQYIRTLDPIIQGLSNDIFLIAGNEIDPIQVNLLSAGVHGSSLSNKLEWSMEAYYKLLSNVSYIDYVLPSEFTKRDLYKELKVNGSGKSMGVEFYIRYKTSKKLSTSLAYTLSRTTYQFDNFNKGKSFLSNNDRTHNISITGSYKISDSKKINILWNLSSGTPFTVPAGFVPAIDSQNGYYVNNGINNRRLPFYHRMDVSYTKEWYSQNGLRKEMCFSVFNTYANPATVLMFFNFGTFTRADLLVFIPSITYKVNF
jgi:outer membrane cobalamin receptor